MSAPPPTPSSIVSITRVENFSKWFSLIGGRGRPSLVDNLISLHVRLHATLPNKQSPQGYELLVRFNPTNDAPQDGHVAVVRHLYDKTIGHVGCLWANEGIPIEYKHAKVRFGDLFEFYTTPDGVLRLPDWCSMRFAVDQFLEEEPRIKFHPSRVQKFIDQNGMDELDAMD